MARSPYSIFKRKRKDGTFTYCARFFDDTGEVIKTCSFPKARTESQAARAAEVKLKEGVLSRTANPDALEYLYAFWTRGSDYVKGRELRGVVLSERYLYESRAIIKKHLEEFLRGKRFLDISPAFLEKTILALHRKGVSARRINLALQTVKVPFAYFCRIHRLPNPLTSILKLRENPRERGILTIEELSSIVALEGESPRAKAAVLLGALCGLRLGEVRGLQWADVDFEKRTINIRGNVVDEAEGRKAPKWGSSRMVPAPAPVLDSLRLLGDVTPGGDYVVFNDRDQARACCAATIESGFRRILTRIGISEEERKSRNLVFHGLRHNFITLSRAHGVPDWIVRRMAGHSSASMTELYSHTENIVDFEAARISMESALKAAGRE